MAALGGDAGGADPQAAAGANAATRTRRRGISRRTFLKVTGLSALGAYAATKLGFPFVQGQAPAAGAAGTETWVPSVCAQCPGMCGILVRVVDGRAVKIEGNPKHPANQGRLCPKAQAGLQVLYDPDRVKGPLRRSGPRGSGQWESITWDEAIEELVGKMRDLRAQNKAHTVVSISGRRLGQMTDVVENFMKAYGSPNHVRRGATCSVGGEKGIQMMTGSDKHRAHDWANANYVLLFGYAILEASRPLTYNIGAYANMRRGRPVRGKVVMVDPRMGTTAGRADEWVPIKMGTDGAMALAMANVIVGDKLHDEKFLRDQTDAPFLLKGGKHWIAREFEEEKDGVKTKYQEYYVWDEAAGAPAKWSNKTRAYEPATAKPALLGEHEIEGVKAKTVFQAWREEALDAATPEWQEAITGVPAATVRRLARELAATKPAIVDAGNKGTSAQSNGAYTVAAIHSLNALVGALEAPGGILSQKGYKLKALPLAQDDAAKESYKQPRLDKAKTKKWPLGGNVIGYVPTAILDDGYEVNVLISHYASPFFSFTDTERWRKAMAKVGYLVSLSPFMDEFTASADLVLPDRTYLERYQHQPTAESVGYPALGLRQPVVTPLYDTMDNADVFIRLAKALGGKMAETFPFDDNRALTDSILSALKPEEVEALKRDGAIGKPPYKFGDYAGAFGATPSKRLEFNSMWLHKEFDKLKMTEEDVAALGIAAKGNAVFMPHYEPPRYAGGSAADYPLLLNTYKLTVRGEGRTSNSPYLSEALSPLHPFKYDTWAEINPETARRHGIEDGKPVWVESTLGRIQTKARVFAGCEPGTVSIPHHLGHRGYGRWSQGRGANPNDIIVQDYDYLCGQSAYQTRVKVYPAGGEA